MRLCLLWYYILIISRLFDTSVFIVFVSNMSIYYFQWGRHVKRLSMILTQRVDLYRITPIRLHIFVCRCTRVPVVREVYSYIQSQSISNFSTYIRVVDKPGVWQGDGLGVVVRGWGGLTGTRQCYVSIDLNVKVSCYVRLQWFVLNWH